MAPELDFGTYRAGAEAFVEATDREYLLHLSGRKPELELAPIYERHADLFTAAAVESLTEAAEGAEGDEGRRRRYLLRFAFDGLLGEATKAEAEEAAGLEASLEVAVDGRAVPYRQVPVEQANESDAGRRQQLELARNALLAERLNPVHLQALERAHALCRELGWRSYADAYAGLRSLDFGSLAERTARLLAATESAYAPAVDPLLERAALPPLGELRRSDMPRFFRAPDLDRGFPAERLVPALAETLAGLGIDLERQAGVHLDTESRPSKSPRAFCAPVRVPDEVHLVISPVGGRDDFAALFHEAGHTEHYACVDPALAFEFRHLGDNAVTESFAFLLEHLTEDPEWLRARLGVGDAEPVVANARAVRLVMLRRYAAKLAYERELHGEGVALAEMPARYAELLTGAIRVDWPQTSWLADVDPGFYVSCYLRAWALEAIWRDALHERFGARWFERREAGDWLRELWAQGQRLGAEELVGDALGRELSFEPLIAELAAG
ncbi:MAG TPA: hypothetical protein VK919_07260 [Solirubrobacterales bacterium]|nr:hypothetical protein [Solirubrobacterales bacterium]